ncbi:MAG TPA: hypothetical protein VE871_16315 [Longimicrobium sp.]|nr:hypothetical protein [Longimicrobium sp.]
MGMMTTVRRGVLGAATAAALGFGATQALAAPASAVHGAKVCDDAVCDRVCDLTNRGLGGFCSSTGVCVCWR